MCHKSCYNKFNTTKLQRAEKRKFSIEDIEPETTPARKYTRKSARHEDKTVQDICFIYANDASASDPLREVATKRLDYRVQSRTVFKGFCKMLLCTVDTDVVVLSVAAAIKLDIPELWVAFRTGKNFRYIPVHEIVASIGPDKYQALPFFHAYTVGVTVFYSLLQGGRNQHGILGEYLRK